MRCIICDKDDWKNVDHFRIKAQGMSLCNQCGFVSYPDKYKTKKEIKEYYLKDYRSPPQVGNLYTGQRKLHYHNVFLKPLFSTWKKENKTDLVIGEVGSAYGMFLNWVKGIFPKADVNGSEWTLSYRRNAFHEYGIKLDTELDLKNKQYDLICSYKVAEHQMDADKELRAYVEALKPGGHIYVSVPTWFNEMGNFGLGGFDIEYYYHPDHINVWTQKLFETLLKKVGLEVVQFNNEMYNETYLCVRNDDLMKETPDYENPVEIESYLKSIHDASMLYQEQKFKEALDVWPNFPISWITFYEMTRKQNHDLGYEKIIAEIIEPFKKACPNSYQVYNLAGDISMRYNKWKEAIEYLNKALDMRPECPIVLTMLSQTYRCWVNTVQNKDDKLNLLKEARGVMRHLKKVSQQHYGEAINWIYQDNAKLSFEGE